jgi:hypothetical protein
VRARLLGDAEEGRARGMASSRSSTAGVTSGSGPSSIVIATLARAMAAAGRRTQFDPSQVERGQSPVAVSSAWFSTTAPAAHGHSIGSAAAATPAPTCQATLALTSSGGCHRVVVPGVAESSACGDITGWKRSGPFSHAGSGAAQ